MLSDENIENIALSKDFIITHHTFKKETSHGIQVPAIDNAWLALS